MMKSTKMVLLWYCVFNLIACNTQNPVHVQSPNGILEVELINEDGDLKYHVLRNGQPLIHSSSISIFEGKSVEIIDSKSKSVQEQWEPVWGQFSKIEDIHNALEVELNYDGIEAILFIRAYDDGLAFRFQVDNRNTEDQPTLFMEYDLPGESMVYSPAGEGQPFGPLSISEIVQSEGQKQNLKMPILLETAQNQFLSLLESDLISAPGFEVLKFKIDQERKKLVSSNTFNLTERNFMTPWRVILVEEQIGDLLMNTVPLNLAAPNQLPNTDWIKPGKTMWDWRVHGFTTADGFTYGKDNESYFRFIDFAAENNIEYFLIDDAWYTDVSAGHIEMSEKLDLTKVEAYAKEKDVDLILYYDRRQGNYGDDALFPYYQSLGMKGIKYGFMGSDVDFTRNAIRKSAENQLLIDFHDGPVPMSGVIRTYPNAITREYCHAQQDSRRAFTPKTFIRMALINAIQGPLDMNNGIFDINSVNAGEREKGPRKLNSLFTTVTAEAARTLIIFSGLVCIPDAPESYQRKMDLFEFIKKMPVGKWDESRVLSAKMDEHISTARRYRDEWFIGSVHVDGGTLDISLDFLKEGLTYQITLYEDTEQTNSKTNPEAYRVSRRTVKKGDVIKATMVASGGHCMWIRPE